MKIIKSSEEPILLIEGVSETIKNAPKKTPKKWIFWYVAKINGVYSRNNLPKIKDEAYVIAYKSIGLYMTHWIALYVNGNNVILFYSFGVELILKEIRKFIDNKNITTNICRIQTKESIMCGYFCIRFIYAKRKKGCYIIQI